MTYLTKPLDKAFDKKTFFCGISLLDNYLHKQASQDMKRKLAICFVLPDEGNVIKGYYTLSSDSIHQSELPEKIKSKLPKSYSNLPITLLGRLAVDSNFQGQGLGKLLLLDALKRSYDVSKSSIGAMAVVVQPFDSSAVSFYNSFGFISLPASGKMFITMKTISQLFE